ncbi:hypothetical protein NE237_001609 [Protea cynaroides]|uniref:Uncharacterized protein n=1 Tax=Protea cynaroides TaxID=273540 RepID=A0A9Q0KTF6_9MAGN|nr:hypothetical protein NE237_001609 [Protea cynaroides]
MARSSMKVVYRAFANATAELIWLNLLLTELGAQPSKPPVLCSPSSSDLGGVFRDHETWESVKFRGQKWLSLEFYLSSVTSKITHWFRGVNPIADYLAETAAKHVLPVSNVDFLEHIVEELRLDALSKPRSETRPLDHPSLEEGRRLSESFRTLFEIAKHPFKQGVMKEEVIGAQHDPERLSPGGPDPQHHSKNQSIGRRLINTTV